MKILVFRIVKMISIVNNCFLCLVVGQLLKSLPYMKSDKRWPPINHDY